MIKIGIPTAYRPAAIAKILPCVLSQKFDNGESFIVTVVNGTPCSFTRINEKYSDLAKEFPDVVFINEAGSPANGRLICSQQCGEADTLVLLDDDTLPSTTGTINELVNFLRLNDLDIASGVWDCQKIPTREFGTKLHDVYGVIVPENLKLAGTQAIHMPLATFAVSPHALKKISFDPNIKFYGDLFDVGMSVLRKGLKCCYDSTIIFHHLNIANDPSSTFNRPSKQWQYLSNKWDVGIIHDKIMYSPIRRSMNMASAADVGKQFNSCASDVQKLFIVELNRYHFETIPPVINCLQKYFREIHLVTYEDNVNMLYGHEELRLKIQHHEVKQRSEIIDFLVTVADSEDYIFLNSAGSVDRTGKLGEPRYLLKELGEIDRLRIFKEKNIFAIHHDCKLTRAEREQYGHIPLCLQPFMAKIYSLSQFSPIVKKVNRLDYGLVDKQADIVRFIVPGLVDPERRDYEYIIDVFIKAAQLTKKKFILDLCGVATPKNQPYIQTLMQRVEDAGVADCFEFPAMQGMKIKQDMLDARLREATFLVFGLNADVPSQREYLANKASGSLALSMSYQLIPILASNYATAYGLSRCALTYTDQNEFVNVIVSAAEASIEQLTSWFNAVSIHADHAIENNNRLFDRLCAGIDIK